MNGLKIGFLLGLTYFLSVFSYPLMLYFVTLIVNSYDLPYLNVLIARNLIHCLTLLFSLTS
jgi:hypothetical protein